MQRNLLSVSSAIFMMLAGTSVPAVTIHTWVDENGVRHYADAPPDRSATAASQFEIPASATATDSGDDYYSIVNQWERLRAEREADAARALERERLASQERVARAAAAPDYGPERSEYDSYPIYPPSGGRRWGPHGGPPGHPGHDGPQPAPTGGGRRNAKVNATPPVWPSQR